MKKVLFVLSGLLITLSSFAQEAASTEKAFLDDPLLPIYLITGLIVMAIILVSVVGVYAIRILNTLTEQAIKEKSAKTGVAYVPSTGWWEQFTQKMNASVPVEQEKDIELDHSYDGIKELDNHLPPWWKWLFYGTIGWSAIYIVAYHFTDSLPLSMEEYQTELAIAAANAQPTAIDENNLQFTNDPAIIENGKKVFASNPCGTCHRSDGGGNTIGPNLTDEYWLHGGDIKSIFATIKKGVVDKGMPEWGKAMSAKDVRDVTFYVMSLQGSNPPDGKAPQGELFKKTTIVKSDSTNAQATL